MAAKYTTCLMNRCTRQCYRRVQHLYMCCPPHVTGPDPGISAMLMHVACMTHMHLTTSPLCTAAVECIT